MPTPFPVTPIFNIVPILAIIMFVMFVIFAIILIIRTAQNLAEWSNNNNSPLLTVSAHLVTKRMAVNHRQTLNNANHNLNDGNINQFNNVTIYFATFQVESGDRMEFRISDKDFGLLAENDFGNLTFQGSRFKHFERNLQ
ncbi:MAG: DUF2500 domain-containing protein [Firmicutes bacterium]|nr:DUF2500 domain-containing protein [Bacillota bacterium]